MNYLDAAHATGHDYPGGTRALALRLGMRGDTLSHKLNPNCKEHQLSVVEAMRMQSLTSDHRILQAMADELGYVMLAIPLDGSEDDVSIAVLDACAEVGDYLREVADDWRDRKITQTERKRLEAAAMKALTGLTHLQSLLSGKAGK